MNEKITSYVLVAVKLDTPISLGSVLTSGEVTYDSHITLLTAPEVDLGGVEELEGKINLGDIVKTDDSYEPFSVLDTCELTVFPGEREDWLVLKFKEGNVIYERLKGENEKLTKTFSVTEPYKKFQPHISLAKIPKGTWEGSEALELILRSSYLTLEDLILSKEVGDGKFSKANITSHNAVERYFRELNLVRESEELAEE